MWRPSRYIPLFLGLCTLATCPTAKRACDSRAHGQEGDALLDYLEQRLRLLHADGKPWPTASAPVSPPRGACCDQGGQCAADATVWDHPTWRALQFSLEDRHYYSYEYIAMPDGAAVIRAIGDIECDGSEVTYERIVRATAQGGVTVKRSND